jgi:hypothetical protein
LGFVDNVVLKARPGERGAINPNFLPLRIDPRTQARDHLAVHFDAPFKHNLFALAATGDAGGSEYLLQSLAARLRFRCRTLRCPWRIFLRARSVMAMFGHVFGRWGSDLIDHNPGEREA